ncbi:diaminopimelate epimerase [Clostridium sp. DL1XJH146]
MFITKVHGTGNDFVIIEDLENKLVGIESSIAKKVCHRRFGVGADGILIVRKSNIANIKMVIVNSDGSFAEMCGNGIRCFAKYVFEKKLVNKQIINIETEDGVKKAFLNFEGESVESVKINMGKYSLQPSNIPATSEYEILDKEIEVETGKEYKITSMLMGVPHTMIFGKLDDFDIDEGKYIEKYKLFPKNTNVNFCEIVDQNNIRVKTWERGAGPTMSCGTGSCASAVAAMLLKNTDRKVFVHIPGGKLLIEINNEEEVFMTGPAVIVFQGELLI